jgi:hypothetical protein
MLTINPLGINQNTGLYGDRVMLLSSLGNSFTSNFYNTLTGNTNQVMGSTVPSSWAFLYVGYSFNLLSARMAVVTNSIENQVNYNVSQYFSS